MTTLRSLAITMLVAAACTGTTSGGDDAGADAPAPPIDAAADAPPDAPPDAAIDAAIDAPLAPCDMPTMADEVVTLAGCPTAGASDGVRGMARFANPVNVLAGDGEVYVADFDNGRVRAVAPDGATRTLVAAANFRRPFGLALAGGVLYVSTDDNDQGLHSPTTGTVWRVELASGAVEVVARDLGRPRGLLALPDGRLVLADYVHHTVSLLTPTTGAVVVLAGVRDQPGFADGRGAAARFDGAYGVALLPDGRIAVADYNNHRVRAITLAGDVTTLAGTGVRGHGDGPAASATFGAALALAADAAGRLYISDTESFTVRVLADGAVTTVAGSGTGGWLDGPRLSAQFWGLEGLDVAADGQTLWVADGSRGEDVPYHRVRRVTLP